MSVDSTPVWRICWYLTIPAVMMDDLEKSDGISFNKAFRLNI